jgi:hypothetical protein
MHPNSSRFLNTNSKGKKAWDDIFQTLKENNSQPRLVYTAKICFITEGYHSKQKLKEFITPNHECKKYLKEFYTKIKAIDIAKKMKE